MKNRLGLPFLFISFILFFNFLCAEPYPAPGNLNATIGVVDTIKVSWEIPTPPAFGEGFESGEIPPPGWSNVVKNENNTWQIMNNVDYVHSGSYSACVPWTSSPGVLLGYGEEKILNGDFTLWNEGLPIDWDVQTLIHIDSLNMEQDILAFSSTSVSKYISQTFPTNKYSHYLLSFKSKQDNIDSTSIYKVGIYAGNSVVIEEELSNPSWESYEFDVYTSSNVELQIRLFPSDESDSTLVYWDDISVKEIKYDPNQDEWLVSSDYQASPTDILNFYLGTSKMYGKNAPVYVLLSLNSGETWDDTLIVCDGMDNIHNTWGNEDGELKEYMVPFSDFLSQEETIKLAFRYVGGNGDLVCLDDVGIITGNDKIILDNFYVIQKDEKINQMSSRAKKTRSSKQAVLTGFELYRKIYYDETEFESIALVGPFTNYYNDIPNDSSNINIDVAYAYKVKAVYNNIIKSPFSNSDIGCLYDNIKPAGPRNSSIETKWTSGENWPGIKLFWKNPYNYADIDSFFIYDNDILIIKIKLEKDPGNYAQFVYQSKPVGQALPLHNNEVDITITSVDFNGNESVIEKHYELYPPPSFSAVASQYYYQIRFNSKNWIDSLTFNVDDSIRIYRSLSEDIGSFHLYKVLDDSSYYTTSGCVFLDENVNTTKDYWYYSTMVYHKDGETVESEPSGKYQITSRSKIDEINIADLTHALSSDSIVTFTWIEPTADSLTYGGVYVYKGVNTIVPIDTVYKGTNSYEYIYNTPVLNKFTFLPFDAFGLPRSKIDDINVLYNIFGKMEYVHICLDTSKVIETFQDGLDPLWSQINLGDNECKWYASNDGSSQWFSITDYDGDYGWINDDLFGQFAHTDCYLSLPPIVGLSTSDKVILCFEGFLSEKYDGSAYIALNPQDQPQDIINIYQTEQYRRDSWRRYSLNLTPYLHSTIDSFQIAFHYNDNDSWCQGWAIDNVYVLSTSKPVSPVVTKFDIENQEYYFSKTFPNPFKDKLNFSFILEKPTSVSFDLYNIKGQRVKSIEDEYKQGMNNIVITNTDNDGNKLPTGIYLYKIVIQDKVLFDKVIHID